MKIFPTPQKKLVLDEVKYLRNSEYRNIYIRRDYAYVQRGELKRRMKAEAANTNSKGDSASPGLENWETIPKTVFSNEMARATEEPFTMLNFPPPVPDH